MVRKPAYQEAFVERGLAYAAVGDFARAEQDLSAALTLNGEDARAWRVRGALREQLRNDPGAIIDYTEAIKRDSRDPRLYLARAAVFARIERYEESLKDRDIAVQLAPNSAEVYVARGSSFHFLNQHEKGLADRTKAIELDPASVLAWTARGNAYYLLKRYDEAMFDIRQALKFDPNNKQLQDLYVMAEAKSREIVATARAEARTADTIAVRLPGTAPAAEPAVAPAPDTKPAMAPEPPPTKVEPCGRCEGAPGAENAARDAQDGHPFSKPPAVVATPVAGDDTAAGYYKRGRAMLVEDKFAEAVELLDQAIKLDQKMALAYNSRGYAHYRLKHLPQALSDLDMAIQLNPSYANAYQNRSSAKKASGDAAGSEADAAKAKDLIARLPK